MSTALGPFSQPLQLQKLHLLLDAVLLLPSLDHTGHPCRAHSPPAAKTALPQDLVLLSMASYALGEQESRLVVEVHDDATSDRRRTLSTRKPLVTKIIFWTCREGAVTLLVLSRGQESLWSQASTIGLVHIAFFWHSNLPGSCCLICWSMSSSQDCSIRCCPHPHTRQ